MKKLLLSLAIATISIASIQAQPVAQDAQFAENFYPTYSGNLNTLVTGDNQPFTYSLVVPVNDPDLEVTISQNGSFVAGVPIRYNGETQFQYTATDTTGAVSNPGTVTIKFGQEKG